MAIIKEIKRSAEDNRPEMTGRVMEPIRARFETALAMLNHVYSNLLEAYHAYDGSLEIDLPTDLPSNVTVGALELELTTDDLPAVGTSTNTDDTSTREKRASGLLVFAIPAIISIGLEIYSFFSTAAEQDVVDTLPEELYIDDLMDATDVLEKDFIKMENVSNTLVKKDSFEEFKKIEETTTILEELVSRIGNIANLITSALNEASKGSIPDLLLGSSDANAAFYKLAFKTAQETGLMPVATSKAALKNHASLVVNKHQQENAIRMCLRIPFTSQSSGIFDLFRVTTLSRPVGDGNRKMRIMLETSYLARSASGTYTAFSDSDIKNKCTTKTRQGQRVCSHGRTFDRGTDDGDEGGQKELYCLRALVEELGEDEVQAACTQFMKVDDYGRNVQVRFYLFKQSLLHTIQ